MRLIEKLKEVQIQKKASLAANFYNLENCGGIVKAASTLKSAMILQLTYSSIKFMGLKTAVGIARTVSAEEKAQTRLHLDYYSDISLIKTCFD